MDIVDSHIHWFPEAYYKFLAGRATEPRAELDGDYWKYMNGNRSTRPGPEWFRLESHFETAAKTGVDTAMICSLGIHSDLDGLSAAEAREGARLINEEWAGAQRRYGGRFFGAAAVPLQDTQMAIEELNYAIETLDLRGVSMPGSIAGEPIAAPRLEAFYARVEDLGVPLLIHPTDGVFVEPMAGYNGGIYRSLGRVVDSSVAVLHLVLSGLLDRHPDLKILHFHAGGVLPFAAGRLDKNCRVETLEESPTAYLKRMWVDTAMPHTLAISMAREFYGPERVVYGSDTPCWYPHAALETVKALNLTEDKEKAILRENVRGLFDLSVRATDEQAHPSSELADAHA